MKKITKFSLINFLCLTILLGFILFSSGQQTGIAYAAFNLERINYNTQISYLKLDSVSALYADVDGSIYVSDQNGIYKDDQLISSNTVRAMHMLDGQMLMLLDDGVYDINGKVLPGDFDTFAIDDSAQSPVMYLGKGFDIFEYSISLDNDTISMTNIKEKTVGFKVEKLCVTDEGLFGIFDGDRKTLRRIGEISTSESLLAPDKYLSDICKGADGTLIYLSLDSLSVYRFPAGKVELIENKQLNSGGALCSYVDGKIFISTDKNSIDFVEWDSFIRKGLYASLSDDDWFFDTPSGVYSRRGITFVADTYNNRLSVFENGTIEYISLANPVSMVMSSKGERIVAFDKNIIKNISTNKSISITANGVALRIEKLAIDATDTVYALASNPELGQNYIFKLLTDASGEYSYTCLEYFINPLALGIKTDKSVFVYDGKIKTILGETYKEFATPLIDFCIDYKDKVFAISSSQKLITIEGNSSTTHTQLGNFYRIAIRSFVRPNILGGYNEQNELLLLDSLGHSLFKINGTDAGITGLSGFFESPINASDDNTLHSMQDNALAKIQYDTTVFILPIESDAGIDILSDSIVYIMHDVPAPSDMFYIITEDKRDGHNKLLSGYIYKAAVDTPFEYQPPQKNQGRIILGTKVYNYPSRQANEVGSYTKGASVRLLSFYQDYQDKDGKGWHRISIDGKEAFIPKEGTVNFNLISLVSDPPDTNAVITEDAVLYTFDEISGKYQPLDQEFAKTILEKGTRVQTETPFDSNKKYTRVEFLIDGQRYDIECFVETKHIDYDGLDRTKVIIICIIIFLSILLVVLIVWFNNRKRKRINSGYYQND